MNRKTQRIVRKIRDAEGLWRERHGDRTPTVRELAELAGVSPSSVSSYSRITNKRGSEQKQEQKSESRESSGRKRKCSKCGKEHTGRWNLCFPCYMARDREEEAQQQQIPTHESEAGEKPKDIGETMRDFDAQEEERRKAEAQAQAGEGESEGEQQSPFEITMEAIVQKIVEKNLAEFEAPEKVIEKIIEQTESQRPTITINTGSREWKLPEHELFHQAFPKALRILSTTKQLWLIGDTGGGKTHMAAQMARALELRFYCLSCTQGMTEGQLLGRLGFGNEYLPAPFVEAYEMGGVFLLDEFDAMNDNVRLVANSALANGVLSVPNRVDNPVAYRHEDFHVIIATNSTGSGATKAYSGRDTIDLATQDRFAMMKVHVGYDLEFEKAIPAMGLFTSNGNAENEDYTWKPSKEIAMDALAQSLQQIRENIHKYKIPGKALSTRCKIDASRLLAGGLSPVEILEAYFVGWSAQERNKALTGTEVA